MTKTQRDRIALKAARAVVDQLTLRKVAKRFREAMEHINVGEGDTLKLNYEVKVEFFKNGKEVIK